jgi:uncharacterized protein (DUF58 family)
MKTTPEVQQALAASSSWWLQARVVAQALEGGLHRSQRLGGSSDFAEYTSYVPGDDVRRIDWRAFGRTDRVLLRRYDEDARMGVGLVLDASSSMGVPTTDVTKMHFAKQILTVMAMLAAQQQDAPGVTVFAGAVKASLPTGSTQGHVQALAAHVQQAQADGGTHVGDALQHAIDALRPRGLLVLCSDLVDVDPATLQRLRLVRARGGDAVVVHVLHHSEVDFRYEGITRFEHVEQDRHVVVDAPLVRRAYQAQVERFWRAHEQAALDAGAHYLRVTTNEGLSTVVASLLQRLGGARGAR